MWQEARKQEKKIREVMIDYQKRAERRREHYEKLRGDPHQYLRIHGNKCRMHLDPKTVSNLDSTMIPWQGDSTNIISQYDVRINMDYIPDYSKLPEKKLSKEEKYEESRCNYERYRTLVQNIYHKTSEAEALAKIETEEMYKEPVRKGGKKKKKGAAIGYTYEDPEVQQRKDEEILAAFLGEGEVQEEEESSDSEFEIDMDVDSFKPNEVDRLNVIALDYGLQAGAFSRSLRAEKSDLAEQKLIKLAEMERNAHSGRKARKAGKSLKENLPVHGPHLPSPPSYSQRDSPDYKTYEGPEASSPSSDEEFEDKFEFITEFGGESEPEAAKKKVTTPPPPPPKPEATKSRGSEKAESRRDRHVHSERRRERSRERSRGHRGSPGRRDSRDRHSRHHHYGSRHRRSRSRSRDRYYSSRKRSHRSCSYSRSWSRERDRDRNRDRERDWSRGRHRDRRRYSRSSSRSSSRGRDQYHSRKRRARSYSDSSDSERERTPPRKKLDSGSRPSPPKSSSHSRSRSRSPSPVLPPPAPSPPIKRTVESAEKPVAKAVSKPQVQVPAEKGKLSHRERMQKKMQALLSKQYKTDKKTQKAKEKVKRAERMEREEELRVHQKKVKDVEEIIIRDFPEESDYTISGSATTYKDEKEEGPEGVAKSPSRSPSPDSPLRILTQGLGKDKDNNDFYYGRFN